MVPPTLSLPRTLDDATLVVAELSANHGGSLERALETVRAVAAAGAGAIKLQTYTADTLTLDCERAEFQIDSGPWAGRSLHELYTQASTPWEWHAPLRDAAAESGLALFSTPFDTTALEFLERLGVPAHKVASFELVDLELVRAVARTSKPLVLSTGLATREELREAVGVVREVWGRVDRGLVLLHCVSAYPAPAGDMNLATIADLAREFDCVTGLSDHTLGTAAAVAAVALGARVIEKHVTLSRAAGGPDAHFSLEPAELARLVEDVRTAERAVGTIAAGPVPSEAPNRRFRRSIFVVRDVGAGEKLTRENVRVIRPGHGLAPRYLPEVLGRAARRDCARGTPLSWDLIE